MKRFCFALTVFAGAFFPAYAEDAAEIPAAEKAFVMAEEAKMRAAGLDAKPLYNKVREGLAKGVSGDALRKAVTRERELFEQAAKMLAQVPESGKPSKTEIAKSIVIATKRGAKAGDISTAIGLHRQDGAVLVGVIDMLGDFAKSGIHGERAVRAATDSFGRKTGIPPVHDRNEGRADQNRSILQRDAQQNLPANRPVSVSEPRPPSTGAGTGTQGDKHK